MRPWVISHVIISQIHNFLECVGISVKLHDSTRPLTEKCESLIHHSYPPAPIDVRLMHSPNASFSQYYSFNNKTMPGLIHHENKTCAKYCFCYPFISKRLHFLRFFFKMHMDCRPDALCYTHFASTITCSREKRESFFLFCTFRKYVRNS